MPRPRARCLPPPPGWAGFSLPELMICLVLLALAIAVGTPQLQALQRRQQLRQAAAALAGQLEAARGAALRSNQPCELSAGGNQLRPSSGCGEPPLAALKLAPAIRLESPAGPFRFSASGALTGAPARQELVLALAGLEPRTCLSVERPSALVRIGQAPSAGSPCRYAG
jgi:prepilin-type N-terminal cleavage/methylation domain-containing protein